MKPHVTVIIADDHPVVRTGLRQVLERSPGVEILHDTGNGDSALQLIRQSRPDIAILDVEMPVMDGFGVAYAIQQEELPVNIIFMTMHNDEQTFNKAMDIGVNGFILKENAVSEILSAVNAVLEGRHYISPSLSDYLMQRARPRRPELPTIDELTPAEKTILKSIAEQKTTKTIAEELFISPKTVEKHRSNICTKLNLHGAYALLKFAIENRGRM